MLNAVLTPKSLLILVWPLPRSLATTSGISVDFFSSSYLDVSVQTVPLIYLFIQYMIHELHSCGLLHSEIPGSMCACHSPELIAAYRVLLRLLMPRHPPCALISLTYSRIMSCFSTEELFEIVFYPLNFFNWISLISSLLFRYSIFKEHLSLSDI